MLKFRFDKFISVHIRSHIKAVLSQPGFGIPILMYHSISNILHGGSHPYYETTTSPEVFRTQMDFLFNNGYRILSLKDAVDLHSKTSRIPGRFAAITFDDGLQDFYKNAFPVLQEFEFPATVFLPTAFIGEQNHRFMRWQCLSCLEVKRLFKAGISFGSHTVDHKQLVELSKKEVEFQLRKSKRSIENLIDCDIDSFSYPFAFPEQRGSFLRYLRETLTTCGFSLGVTTKIGRCTDGEDPLFLKRIPVNIYDDLSLFQSKLEGGYDWMYVFQKIKKYGKQVFRKTQ